MQRVNALAQDNTFGAASRISASVRACSRPGSARQRGRHAVGEEIAIRAQTLVHDAANPAEVMRDVVAFATAGRAQEERDEIIQMIQQTAHEWAVYNFS